VLRRYIVEGHAENERRLRELGQAVSILARLPEGDVNTRQVLDIVRSYAPALDLLDDYDHQSVSRPEGKRDAYVITYDEYGQKCLADEVLVAVTIMIAESRPQEKEVMVSLVMQFLCG
jgi:hypothetical protein